MLKEASMKKIIPAKFKKLIERNPLSLATVGSGNKPNVIGVACVKVVSGSQLLVTDNFMKQTRRNLVKNSSVCLAVWDKKFKGCKLSGTARYYNRGIWKECVRQLPENKGLPAKGAIIVTVKKLIPLK